MLALVAINVCTPGLLRPSTRPPRRSTATPRTSPPATPSWRSTAGSRASFSAASSRTSSASSLPSAAPAGHRHRRQGERGGGAGRSRCSSAGASPAAATLAAPRCHATIVATALRRPRAAASAYPRPGRSSSAFPQRPGPRLRRPRGTPRHPAPAFPGRLDLGPARPRRAGGPRGAGDEAKTGATGSPRSAGRRRRRRSGTTVVELRIPCAVGGPLRRWPAVAGRRDLGARSSAAARSGARGRAARTDGLAASIHRPARLARRRGPPCRDDGVARQAVPRRRARQPALAEAIGFSQSGDHGLIVVPTSSISPSSPRAMVQAVGSLRERRPTSPDPAFLLLSSTRWLGRPRAGRPRRPPDYRRRLLARPGLGTALSMDTAENSPSPWAGLAYLPRQARARRAGAGGLWPTSSAVRDRLDWLRSR